jgi:beta-barrel assembly-enhancing protease
MNEQSECEGGVFSATIEGGRAGARLTFGYDALEAVTAEGARFRLPYAGCQLELGGTSGRMWFCRSSTGDLTLFSESRDFADRLREHAGKPLGANIDAIVAREQASSRRNVVVWSSFLLGFALLLVLGYFGVRQAGRASVDVVPSSVDETIGELALDHMSLQGQVLDDPVLRGAVGEIVQRLSPHATGDFKYQVRVVDAPIVNAFALPGGPIVVYTGLLRAAERPEQLAGVLAHEMAHVTQRHGMRRIAQSIGVVAAIQLLFGDVSGIAAVAIEVLREGAINSYSRDQEREADHEGVRMLIAARIDPHGLADFFALLQKRELGLPSAIAWLGTHPDLRERIVEVNTAAGRMHEKAAPFAFDWAEVQRRANPTAK